MLDDIRSSTTALDVDVQYAIYCISPTEPKDHR